MLSPRFLARLDVAFPEFYDRVNADAMEAARKLRAQFGSDLEKALVRARFEGASRVWWPYVRGTVPLVGNDRPAMEAFSRLILTVDHLVGHPPANADAARAHVLDVLRKSLDVERLRRLVASEESAAAGAGLVASLGAVFAPLAAFRRVRAWGRFVPPPVRITLATIVAAAVLSVPFVAGYSAGHQAEKASRGARPKFTVRGEDPRISP